MISSWDGLLALLNQWRNELLQVDATVFLHRDSETVLTSTIRGSIDNIDENNNVTISADETNIVRFNLLNAKMTEFTIAEIAKLSKTYAQQLKDKETEREYLDPLLLLVLHEDGKAKVSVMLSAIRPTTVQ